MQVIVKLERTFLDDLDKLIGSETFERTGAIIGQKVSPIYSYLSRLFDSTYDRVAISNCISVMQQTFVMLSLFCFPNLNITTSLQLL